MASAATLASMALALYFARLGVTGPGVLVSTTIVGMAGTWVLAPLLQRGAGPKRVAGEFVEYLGLLSFISLAGVIASYPLAEFSRGFSDPLLIRADGALGFKWVSWYAFVAGHRTIQLAGRIFYESVFATPIVLCGYFAFSGERGQAHKLVASYWLAVILTLLFFTFFPARGPLAVLWHGQVPYMPESGLYQATVIDGLRTQRLQQVRIDDLRGIVSIPSFHTAAAVLFICAAWPLRHLRWPVLIVNALMLAAIPVEGTHYLSDMLAGAAVALVSFASTTILMRYRPAYVD